MSDKTEDLERGKKPAEKSVTLVCKTATALQEAGLRFSPIITKPGWIGRLREKIRKLTRTDKYRVPELKEYRSALADYEELTRPVILLDIKLEEEKSTLTIPKIVVEDDTEALFKNLAVFEQCHYFRDSYIIDYIAFMDSLINTKEDVQLLVKEGIIENLLGSDERVADMFNGLGKQLSLQPENFYYAKLCKKLNDYYNRPCNRYLAVLRQKYFNHPWAITSVIYAIVLLLLTVLQSTTGVIQIL